MSDISTLPDELRTHRAGFEDVGFALVHSSAFQHWLSPILDQLHAIADLRLPDTAEAGDLETTLMSIARSNRAALSHIYDAAHGLPALLGASGHSETLRILGLLGIRHATVMDMPRIRIDLPNEDRFNAAEHQESHFYDTPQQSVNLWIPLHDITPDMGPMRVRPGSHKLGRLPTATLSERPFLVMEDGPWQDIPQVSLCARRGDVVAFHSDLIHGSGPNRSAKPRLTVQFRYNSLSDPEYFAQGWPPTFVSTGKRRARLFEDQE